MQRIGVIGMSEFGFVLAESLAEKGADVLVLDHDREKVKRMAGIVPKAVEGDATDAEALEQAGFADCDIAVVAIGSDMEASILATIILKEMKVPEVLSRAASDLHGKVLERVGADRVVYPSKDMARRLARSLWAPTVLDYVEVSEGVSILQMKAPQRWVGKTLNEAEIRQSHGVTVLGIRRAPDADGRTHYLAAPTGADVIVQGDTLTLFGPDKCLQKVERLN
ncbi:MAG: TrkA family potassium uptake protein [Kiritimatiellae bacterium]|nr:TrkA family potassium uptake protein [Kiritimatiellia bacterium]